MGVDFSAIAGVGLRVKADRLVRKVKVRAWNHQFPEDVLFHPRSGQKLWDERDEWVDGYKEGGEFLGYKVANGTYHENIEFGYKHFYIMAGMTKADPRCGGDAMAAVPNAHEIAEFRATMQRAGLWDDAEFGLWAVARVDY